MQHLFLIGPPGAIWRRGWLALLLCVLCGSTAAVAQTTTIGATAVPVVAPATSSYFYGPIYRSSAASTFDWSRYAHLYTPAELNIPTGAIITELAWLKADAGELTGNNVFNVLLENSALTTLGTTQTWGTLSATATTVYSSTTQQITGAAGTYFSVTLSQPFVYQGGNLLLLTDHQKLGTASGVINFVTNPATGFALGYADGSALSATTALTAASYGNRRPTLRVTYAPASPCTAPPTAGTTTASAASVCAGSPVSLSLTGASFGTGMTYQWQESTNGTTFTDIAGATGFSYSVTSAQATRTYRARLTCSGQSSTSTPVTVTVNVATYATLPVTETFENTWVDGCGTRDVPTNSWRNTPVTGNNSWRREDDGTSASWTSPASGIYAPTGSPLSGGTSTHSARFHTNNSPSRSTGLLDLYVNMANGTAGTPTLSFDLINTTGTDSLKVYVSTNGGTSFSATPLASFTTAATWTRQNVALPTTGLTATTIIRLRASSDFGTTDIGLDNVQVSYVTCPAVTGLTASAITATGASIAFTPATGSASYTVTVTPAGGTPTTQTTTTSPVTLTGLTSSTSYTVSIVGNCGGTNGSSAVTAVTFTTACAPAPYVAVNNTTPYTQDFEATWLSQCGTNDVPTNNWRNTPITGNNSWRREDDGASAAWTGPTSGAYTPTGSPLGGGTSAHSARFHTYNAPSRSAGFLDLYVNMAGTSGTPTLNFDHLNTTGTDSLKVYVSTNGGTSFSATPLASFTTAATWTRRTVALPTGLTATTIIRLRANSDFGTTDIGLDNVQVSYITCPAVTGLTASGVTATGATLTFTPTSAATTYTITITPANGTPTTQTASTSPVTLTGLTASTAYTVSIVGNCGTNGSSVAATTTFTTACASAPYVAVNNTTPYTQDFEATWLSQCGTNDIPAVNWRNTPVTGNNSWRREDDGASAAWTGPTSGAYTPAGSPLGGGTSAHSARFHSYNASSGTVGFLDLYVNMAGTSGTPTLSFDYINTSGSDSLKVYVSTNGGSTFSAALAGYNLSSTWARQTVTLPSTGLTATTIIRLRARADFGLTDIGIDNVSLAYVACPAVNSIAVSGITATGATLTFPPTSAASYTVTVTPTGGTPTTVTPAPTTSPITLTGLTASTSYTVSIVGNCGGSQTSAATTTTFTTACITPPYAALPITESFESAWISRCGTNDVPNNNWRNTPVTGNASWRREDDGASAAWSSPTFGAYTPTGSVGTHSARFHASYASSGTIGTFDLFADLSAAGAKRLTFDYINTSGADSLVVQLSNDGGVTFSRLDGFNISGTTATGFVNVALPISSTSATAVIRFRGRADFGSTDIGLDNIILQSATGCLTPAGLAATATTTTTATVRWLTGGTGTYTLVYGPTGFDPTQPSTGTNTYTTVANITAPPYTITGLTPGTVYQFYVTQNCSATTTSGTAGPASFTTQVLNDDPCGALTLTVGNTCTPLTATTFGATQTAATTYGTGGQGTGCGSITAPRDVWFKFTTAATGPISTAVRISVTGGAASVVRAYSGAACTGPLTYVSCAGTSSNTAAPNLDLTNLTPNTTYYVRVNEYSTTGVLGSFTICATAIPNCAAPTALTVGNVNGTTAVLTWSTPVVAGSTFTVFYGPTGFTPFAGGSTLTGITGQTVTLTNLNPNTAYQAYVQQVCANFNGASALTPAVAFTTPLTIPLNDEPCGATALGAGPLTSTTSGATTSAQQPGINLPTCSSAQLPKDVWFAFTPAATSSTLTLTGAPAGNVRLFSSPNCSAGPFAEVFCQASPGNNTAFAAPIPLTGLTPGTRYFLAVSGYGSADNTGSFTIAATNLVLATKAQAETDALLVYPNPSSSGQLTLRLSGLTGTGQLALLNALGQVVLAKALATATPEHTLSTRGLAPGLYTLRLSLNGKAFTRKVVLE